MTAFALRLLNIGADPFYNDEAFSVRVADLPLKPLLAAIAADVHPPLYYILLSGWQEHGEGEGYLRAFSAAFAAASVGLSYLVARRFLAQGWAVAAAFLLMVNSLHFGWSQIVRGYGLMAFLALAATWCALTWSNGLKGAHQRFRLDAFVAASGYVLFSIALLYTHNLGILVILPLAAIVGIHLVRRPETWPSFALPLAVWVIPHAVMLVAWLPWLPTVLDQSANLSRDHFQHDWEGVRDGLTTVLGVTHIYSFKLVLASMFMVIGVFGIADLIRQKGWAGIELAVLVALPVSTCIALYMLGMRAFGYAIQHLVWLPALWGIALVSGVLALAKAASKWDQEGRFVPPRLLASGMFGVVAALQIYGSINWLQMAKPPWNAVAREVLARAERHDLILAPPHSTPTKMALAAKDVPLHAFIYYWQSLGGDPGALGYPTDLEREDLRNWLCGRLLPNASVWVPMEMPAMSDGSSLSALQRQVLTLSPPRQPPAISIGKLAVEHIRRETLSCE